jgi:hypothetical protein
MVELQAVYDGGEFPFAIPSDPVRLKDARVKLVVTVAKSVRRQNQIWLRVQQSDHWTSRRRPVTNCAKEGSGDANVR